MKTTVKEHLHTEWMKVMQQNESTWSTIYTTVKQQPVIEP